MDALDLASQRRVVQRVFRLRTLGLGLGLLPVAVAFHEQGAPAPAWVLALAYALLWPWAARQLAFAAMQPLRVERHSLRVDAIMGGVWIALIQFNLLPSLVIAALLTMDKFAFGGPRLAAQGISLLLASAGVVGWANGFAVAPGTSPAAALAVFPLLIAYPSAIAHTVYTQSQRLRHQADALRSLTRVDALTGLANRQALEEALRHEYRRFRRSGHPAAFLLLDMDHFQQLNDSYGDAAGDTALRAVAEVLQRTLRDVDTVARLDGDSFGIVVPDIGPRQAGELAERLRQAVCQTELLAGTGLQATASLGWAAVDRDMADAAAWMAAADAAVYEAKAMGRNRTRMAHRDATA